MRRFRTLLQRELRLWTLSPGSYFLAALFLAVVGVAFSAGILTDAGRGVLTSELTYGRIVFWIAVLALTALCSVRGFREELDSGAIELLLTVPIRETEIVAAKYLALVEWLGLLCLFAAAPPWVLRLLNPAWHGIDAGAWAAGALLLGLSVAAVAALGIAVSLLFRGTAAAAATFLGGGVLVFGAGSLIALGSAGESDRLAWGAWNPGVAMELFSSGVIDSRWIVLCLSVVAVSLFAAVRLVIALRYRRAAGGANVAVSVVLAVVLAAMANGISMRHYARWDRSSSRVAGLSEETLRTLRTVTIPVKVTLLGPAESDRVKATRRLLRRFKEVCDWLSVESVDPQVDLARTRDLARAHGFRAMEVLIVEGGGRHEVLELGGAAAAGAKPDMSGVRGGLSADFEAALSSVLYGLVQSMPLIGFLTGHGERSIQDYSDYSGYSEIAAILRRNHAAVSTVTIEGGSNECAVLVVAGPASLLTPREADRLREQVFRGVGVVFLLDAGPATGIESMLAGWGVRVGNDRVVESAKSSFFGSSKWYAAPRGEGEVHVMTYPAHPITAGLSGLVSTFYLPRSVEPKRATEEEGSVSDTADRPRVSVLALTGKSSWADSDLDERIPKFNEGYDRRGPVSVGVCVERGAPSVVSMDIKPVRLAVFGDSQFVANRCLTEGNLRLFMNTIRWLLGREQASASSPRPSGVFDLSMPPARRWLAMALISVCIPGAMGVAGLLALATRRDRRKIRGMRGGEAGTV